MTTVILVIHIMIAAALVGIILIQRSEGGALGIGGGGGGGLITARGAANLLTRITAVLAAVFFATSITLALMASSGSKPKKIEAPATQQQGTPAPASRGEQLPKLDPAQPLPNAPQLPQSK